MNQGNNSGKKLSPQILIPAIVGAICVVVVLAVVLLATPKKATASQLQENLKLGSKYLEAGEYDKAEVAFNDALKIDKKSTDATLGLANVYNGKKQPEKALNMLKKAGKNITSTSKSSMKKNSDVWNSRMSNYQNAFAQTKNLFQQQGNTSQVDAAAKEEQKVIKNVTNIINIYIVKDDTPTPEPTVTPTPTSSDNMDDGSGDAASGGLEKKREVTAPPEQVADPIVTATPDPQEYPDPSEEPDPSEDPFQDIENPDDPDPSEDIEVDQNGEYAVDENGQTSDGGDYSPYDYDPYNADNVSYNTDPAYNGDNTDTADSQDTSYDTGSTENGTETTETDTGNTEADTGSTENASDVPSPGQEESYNEIPQGEEQTINVEQPETAEAGTGSDEEILSAYAAQMEISKYTGGSVAYTDSTSMAAVNGVLATEQRDFDGDQRPELLVVSVSGGKMEFTLYKAENGEAQQIAYETADPGFGDPVEGITYSGSQECFIKDNGTSVDIGIAGYYSGMSGENGTPEARLAVAVYKLNSDGTLSVTGNAALVNGTQLYLNGTTPQEGGKDAFISELSKMGLTGSWVSESADALAAMDLINNPMQDTAGVPNPVNAGLSSKETGVQDLAVINVGMQPGSATMDFSVK